MKILFALSLFSVFTSSAHAINFPDACSHEAFKLRKAYHANQYCQSDSDCIYLDSSLREVDPKSGQSLVIDDCGQVPPLVVANKTSINNNREKLAQLMEKMWVACELQPSRGGCNEVKRIQLNGDLPVCDHGFCRVR